MKDQIEKAKADFKINKLNPGYAAAFDLAGNGKIDVSNVISKAEDILGQKLSTFAPETAPATIKKLFLFQHKTPEAKPLGGGLVSSKVKTAAEAPAVAPSATLKDLDDVRHSLYVATLTDVRVPLQAPSTWLPYFTSSLC